MENTSKICKELASVDRERNQRNPTKEKMTKRPSKKETIFNINPDDRDARRQKRTYFIQCEHRK